MAKTPSTRRAIEIDTTGVRTQVELMRKMGVRGADARPAWPLVEQVLIVAEEDQFDSRGHGKWPRIAEATRRIDEQQGRDPRVMRVSGMLYRSLTQRKPRARWRRAKKTEFRWGTKVFYAHFHQQGHGVPVRKVIDLTDEQQKQASQVLGRYVTYGDDKSPTRFFT